MRNTRNWDSCAFQCLYLKCNVYWGKRWAESTDLCLANGNKCIPCRVDLEWDFLKIFLCTIKNNVKSKRKSHQSHAVDVVLIVSNDLSDNVKWNWGESNFIVYACHLQEFWSTVQKRRGLKWKNGLILNALISVVFSGKRPVFDILSEFESPAFHSSVVTLHCFLQLSSALAALSLYPDASWRR